MLFPVDAWLADVADECEALWGDMFTAVSDDDRRTASDGSRIPIVPVALDGDLLQESLLRPKPPEIPIEGHVAYNPGPVSADGEGDDEDSHDRGLSDSVHLFPTLAAPDSKMQRLLNYLDGILLPGQDEELNALVDRYLRNCRKPPFKDGDEFKQFAWGFVKGFVWDGAVGNITGIWDVAKIVGEVAWRLNPNVTFVRLLLGDRFEKERQYVEQAKQYLQMAQRIARTLGEEAGREYVTILEGSPEDLRALGQKHREVAIFLLGLMVELHEKCQDLPPETKGSILGMVMWEVVQTSAETALTAGTATTATAPARFAKLLTRLRSFDKGGHIAEVIQKLFAKGGRLERLLHKLDDISDAGRGIRRGATAIPELPSLGAAANSRYNKLVRLANQAISASGRKASQMLQQLARNAGLVVEAGGKHLTVKTAAGRVVTQIPHSVKSKYTAKAIAEAILNNAQL